MMTPTPVREAPTSPLLKTEPDPSHPSVPQEPVLDIDNIQGNILGGFNKDFQTLLFLKIVNVSDFKHWLKLLIPFIATSAEVLTFNQLFKAIRKRRGEPTLLKVTWLNIAFSFNGLQQLTSTAEQFTDAAFKAGLAARSRDLGDPTDPQAEGNSANWVVGGSNNNADAILIVASDDQDDLFAEVARLENSIYAARSGVQVILKQDGANLPGALAGHEHFGFLDGVSQPGLRGRVSNDPHAVLTPRQNPNNPGQGKPGQDLLWPGEFVFGYPGQNPEKDIAEPGPDSLREAGPNQGMAGPAWAQDGSFLVFRRLKQDVFTFHRFLRDQAQQLGVPNPPGDIGANLVGAKLVGRWHSGAPILRASEKDDTALADNDCANNNFEFQKDASKEEQADTQSSVQCTGPKLFPPSPGDQTGAVCPFAGHIRKSYPRDDTSTSIPSLGEETTQTHRLLRRGVPYGEVSLSTPLTPVQDSVDRGLLFLAYQTSIEEQFEFVTRNWVNNPNFKDPGAGHDPIIGQNNTPGQNRERRFTVAFKDANGNSQSRVLTTQTDWVIPTGGGYFFAPSIRALQETLST
jgi:Dyp-type peroxidase family